MIIGFNYELAILRIFLTALFSKFSDLCESNFTNRFLSLVIAQTILIGYIFAVIWRTFEYSVRFKFKKKAILLIFLLVFAQGIKFIARAYRYKIGKPLYDSGLLQTAFFVILPFYKIYIQNLPSKLTNNLKISCVYHGLVSVLYIAYECWLGRRTAVDFIFELVELSLEYFEFEFTYELYSSEVFFLSEYVFNLLFSLIGVYHDKEYKWQKADNYLISGYIIFQMLILTLSNFDLSSKFAKYKEIKLIIIDSHFENLLNPVFRAIDTYLCLRRNCALPAFLNSAQSTQHLSELFSNINKLAIYIVLVMLYLFNFVIQSLTTYTAAY